MYVLILTVHVFQVTRAFSFTKTPKRAIQRAFMASCTPDEKGCENHAGSSSTLAVSLWSPVLQHGQVTFDDKVDFLGGLSGSLGGDILSFLPWQQLFFLFSFMGCLGFGSLLTVINLLLLIQIGFIRMGWYLSHQIKTWLPFPLLVYSSLFSISTS